MPDRASGRPTRWRVGLAYGLLGLLLVVGVPLHVCSPPWADACFFDTYAQEVVHGATPYRDFWDVHPPGMLGIHLGLRGLFGWRSEVLMAFDLAVVAAVVWLLLAWLRRTGARPERVAWTALLLATYYFATPDVCHAQRDFWLLLPAISAVHLQLRQAARWGARAPGRVGRLLPLAEGGCWGLACLIKPQAIVLAGCCWLVKRREAARVAGFRPRDLAADALAVFAGMAAVGLAACGWLVIVGAFDSFLSHLGWIGEYGTTALSRERWDHVQLWVHRSLPWSVAAIAGAVVAGLTLARWLPAGAAASGRLTGLATALLATTTLVTAAQGALWLMPHYYLFAAAVLPALTLLAARWPARWGVVGTAIAASFVLAAVWTHPLANPSRLACWRDCLAGGSTPQVRDRLNLPHQGTQAVDWTSLSEVEEFLRAEGAADGDVLCYHEFTKPLYVALKVRMPNRHFYTSLMPTFFPSRKVEVTRDLMGSTEKFVVTDLRETLPPNRLPKSPDSVAGPPPALAGDYPWNQPLLFRSGWYEVRKATAPAGAFVK